MRVPGFGREAEDRMEDARVISKGRSAELLRGCGRVKVSL